MKELPDLTTLFPPTKFNIGEPQKQLNKVLEEILEADAELERLTLPGEPTYKTRQALLYEVIDVMQAAAGVLYSFGYTGREIADGLIAVQTKNRSRGYYLPEQTQLPIGEQ